MEEPETNLRNEVEVSSHVILGFELVKQAHLSLPFDLQLKSCKGDHRLSVTTGCFGCLQLEAKKIVLCEDDFPTSYCTLC